MVVFAKGVGFMFLHAACCDVRFSSAGACKCIPWEVHIRVHISVSLVLGKGKKSAAGGSAALMDLLTCLGLGRLLTKWLRTQIFIVLCCVDFRPLT